MADNGEANAPRLLEALQAIASWRDGAESTAGAELEEVTTEVNLLVEQIEGLQVQLASAQERKTQVEDTLSNLDAEELRRSYTAVVAGLTEDRATLDTRSKALELARAESTERAEEMLNNPELKQALDEYEGFAEAEATLSQLPPSYRKAIESHHTAVRDRLKPLFQELDGSGIRITAEPTDVAIVTSIDPAEGPPEALVFVLPVDAGLYEQWDSREQDLQACLGYRMVGAAAQVATRAGVPNAHVSYRPFAGHLAIRVWFGSHPPDGDLRALTHEVITAIREGGRELEQTAVRPFPLWLPPAVLREQERIDNEASPPVDLEDEEDGDDEDTDGSRQRGGPIATLVDEDEAPIPDFYITESEV